MTEAEDHISVKGESLRGTRSKLNAVAIPLVAFFMGNIASCWLRQVTLRPYVDHEGLVRSDLITVVAISVAVGLLAAGVGYAVVRLLSWKGPRVGIAVAYCIGAAYSALNSHAYLRLPGNLQIPGLGKPAWLDFVPVVTALAGSIVGAVLTTPVGSRLAHRTRAC